MRHISRKSNGNLYIDFRKASVAETVSRPLLVCDNAMLTREVIRRSAVYKHKCTLKARGAYVSPGARRRGSECPVFRR